MSLILVRPLIVDGAELLPTFQTEDVISNYGKPPLDVYRSAPTLAQHNHAFFGKNPDGTYASPEYRKSVFDNTYRGEWTSTWLRDGKEAVERPDEVVYENGLWVARGGIVITFDHFPEGKLPPEGWALEYDKPTGFPSRTGSRKEAEKVFGNDASYFSHFNSNGLRAVGRIFFRLDDDSPFGVGANWRPDGRNDWVGSRLVVQDSMKEHYRIPYEDFKILF
jgi:hypothetical protein